MSIMRTGLNINGWVTLLFAIPMVLSAVLIMTNPVDSLEGFTDVELIAGMNAFAVYLILFALVFVAIGWLFSFKYMFITGLLLPTTSFIVSAFSWAIVLVKL